MAIEFWALVKTKPRQEEWAAENAERQGYEFYLPKLRERYPKPRECPLFPSYLFVLTPRNHWFPLKSTFGVAHVIMNEEGPQRVPLKVIRALRTRESEDGVIEINDDEFEEGQLVEVQHGALKNQRGWYKGMSGQQRVTVLFDILGARTPVQLDRRAIIPAV